MTAVIVALVLLGLLVALGAAMAWQGRQESTEQVAIYGVEDSIEWVSAGLSPEARQGMRRSDVRRILEWSVRYLQTPAVRSEPNEPPVVASVECAQYVQKMALEAGHAYDGDVILAILDLQAGYLAAIGAVSTEAVASEDETPGEEGHDVR